MARRGQRAKPVAPAHQMTPEEMQEAARIPSTDEEWEQFRRAASEAASERYRQLSVDTKNPIYIWQAILAFLAHNEPLPDWCIEYIKCCAIEMHHLVVNLVRDERNNGALLPLPPISSAVRAVTDAVPAALQLRRRGWNAFRQYAADQRRMQDGTTAAAAPLVNLSKVDLVKKIARRRQFSETSESWLVRKQIKEGRRLLALGERTKPRA
jgi:hypothetical protein